MAKTVRSLRLLFGFSFRADRMRTLVTFGLDAVSPFFQSLTALWLQYLTDAAVRHDSGEAVAAAGFMSAIFFFSIMSGWSGFTIRNGLEERTASLVDRDLIDLTARAPGLEHHERADYLDEMELLRTQRRLLSSGFGALVMNAGLIIRMGTVIALLGTVHPILMLLPLFGLPSMYVGVKTEKMMQKAQEITAPGLRQCRHLLDLATTGGPAKELRVFGLTEVIPDMHQRLWDENDDIVNRATITATVLRGLGWLTFALGYLGAMALVVRMALDGQATPGQVVLTFTLAGQINAQVAGAVGLVSWLMMTLKTVGRYIWLHDYAVEAEERTAGHASPPSVLADGITFTDVTFTYPGTETPVLEGVDLHLPAGTTVAIVGDNGAGKSTLVKLLCRFYEPTTGTITVDGVDLSDIDVIEWRERMSGGFQDFAKLELIARETVGVGDLPHLENAPVVLDALDKASASTVIATLPGGLESQLGRSFEGGAELSGGQWQKLALGRAMMRPDPLLLVLDEPTAALDADTEHALFERYAGAARRAAGATGAITVLVSHRFSTVRMADLILVIDGGRIVEAGPHADLIERAGLYAELFELQARAYR